MATWTVALAVCCGGWVAAASAADWNQWRGPHRDGVWQGGPELRESLPQEGLRPLWQTPAMPSARSGGWASPIVADGKVYLFTHQRLRTAKGDLPPVKYPYLPPEKRTGMSEQEYEEYERNRRDEQEQRSKAFRHVEVVYCYSAADGKLVWERELPSRYTRFAQSGTPVVHAGKLYFLGAGRMARCLDAATGEPVWEQLLPGEFRDEFLQSSVAVVDGVAVVLCGHLFGLDPDQGKIVWEADRQATAGTHCSPAVWNSPQGPRVIVNVAEGDTICVVPKTGEIVWRVESEGKHSTPVIVQDKFLLTYGSSRKAGLRMFRLGAEGAEPVWKFQRTADQGSSPVVVGDHVYVQGERRLACVDLQTGTARWQTTLDLANPRYTSLVAADGKLIYAFDGFLYFAADPAEYRQLANGKIDREGVLAEEEALERRLGITELRKTAEGQREAERLWRQEVTNHGPLTCASPALLDGRVILRLRDRLVCYDLRKPSP